MHSYLHRSRGLVLTLALLVGSVSAVHARLISVDLQANNTSVPAQDFTGVDPEAAAIDPLFGAANVWNHLGIHGQTVNPTFVNLVDSTGANTTVAFTIVGTVDSFNVFSIVPTADALRGDAFYFNDGSVSASIDWTLTGLTPNTKHLLFFYGGFWDDNRSFTMLVDTNGDGDLSDETGQSVLTSNGAQPPGTLFSAVSDASGVIRGRGVGIGDIEADWAGFQVAEAPAVCGDGLKEAPEQCDDGNTANGDGCSSTCQLENHPPVARCQNITVDATATSCLIAADINNGSSDPDSNDPITLSPSPAGPYSLGATLVTLTVTDSHKATSTCTGTVTVRDPIPPPLSCPGPVTAECAGTSTQVTFATPQPGPDNCGMATSTGCTPTSGTGFALGSTSVRCGATDTRNTSSCSFTVNVVDTIAPTCAVSASPNTLWPPNHSLVTISTSVTVTDSGSGPDGFKLLSVSSSEADSGLAADDVPGDLQGWTLNTADTAGQVRTERYSKNGRTYTLTYQAKDKAGNTATCSTTVKVPHS